MRLGSLFVLFLVLPLCYAASATYPNEPAGYVPFAEAPLDVLPADSGAISGGNTPPGWTGKWFNDKSGHGVANCYLGNDPTAPQSPPGVFVTRFPTGFVAGRGPCFIGGWDAAGSGPAGYKNSFYFSFWLKINNATNQPYENEQVLTKMGWIAYGQTASQATNQGFFTLTDNISPPTLALTDKFKVGFYQQGYVDRTQPGSGFPQTVGVWHHWEALFIVNNPNNNYNCPDQYGTAHWCGDGTLRMWVDGTKIVDKTDMAYTAPSQTNPFYSYIWNPTWGGGGDTKTQTDYMYIDHIYMSEPGSGGSSCGNGQIDSGEQCDGSNLNGASCASQGFASGTLGCNPSTCQYDTTACVAASSCGNGQIDAGEQCDGSNLNGKTCVTQGFSGGALSCSGTCQFITSACTSASGAPIIVSATPQGTLPTTTTSVTTTVTTDVAATCAWNSNSGLAWSSLSQFTNTGGTTHTRSFQASLTPGSTYTRYIRCRNAQAVESAEYPYSFTIAAAQQKTGDLNADGVVNILDVQRVVAKLGQGNVQTGEDLNGDGIVNIYDLVVLAQNWG